MESIGTQDKGGKTKYKGEPRGTQETGLGERRLKEGIYRGSHGYPREAGGRKVTKRGDPKETLKVPPREGFGGTVTKQRDPKREAIGTQERGLGERCSKEAIKRGRHRYPKDRG